MFRSSSLILIFASTVFGSNVLALDVKDLIHRTEQQSLGKSFHGRLRMKVERPEGTRELEILSWTEGKDKALVKVLKPAKDRGTGNLRLEFNLWQYLPKIERTIKVPPSLMLQSWMGSDFTNDDLVKTTRLSRDYECTHEKDETLGEVKAAKMVCMPKPDAPVVWGKLLIWIEPKQAVLMKQEFFTENGEKVKEMIGSEIKTFSGHTLASRLTMTTLKKKTVTTLDTLDAQFDKTFDKQTFTQAFMQAPLKND
jgi:hypothetical protein